MKYRVTYEVEAVPCGTVYYNGDSCLRVPPHPGSADGRHYQIPADATIEEIKPPFAPGFYIFPNSKNKSVRWFEKPPWESFTSNVYRETGEQDPENWKRVMVYDEDTGDEVNP